MTRYNLQITKDALEDIDLIFQDSIENWGRIQANKYKDKLYHLFHLIQENPFLGRISTGHNPKYREFVIEQHIVFYFLLN